MGQATKLGPTSRPWHPALRSNAWRGVIYGRASDRQTRATKKFEKLYKGRTAVERLNARLKVFWGADDGNISGSRRFHAHIGVVLVVHMAFATLLASAPRWEGTLGQLKLSPIAQALHGKRQPKPAPKRRRARKEYRQATLFR